MAAKNSRQTPAPVVTPNARIKRSDTQESVPKVPKLDKKVQSKRLLKQPSDATMHYSPQGQKQRPAVRKTAVKAKSKKKSSPKQRKATQPEETTSPKLEDPPPATAAVVQQALGRKTTAEMPSVSEPEPSASEPNPAPSASASEASGSEAESEQPAAGEADKEQTIEQVRARKEAHARYMRFSRSIKSKSFLSAFHVFSRRSM